MNKPEQPPCDTTPRVHVHEWHSFYPGVWVCLTCDEFDKAAMDTPVEPEPEPPRVSPEEANDTLRMLYRDFVDNPTHEDYDRLHKLQEGVQQAKARRDQAFNEEMQRRIREEPRMAPDDIIERDRQRWLARQQWKLNYAFQYGTYEECEAIRRAIRSEFPELELKDEAPGTWKTWERKHRDQNA